MRRATDRDLDRLDSLLLELRRIPELRVRKRGYFSRGSWAFVHFHEDEGELYADVRRDATFHRMSVTSGAEQPQFLSWVRTALARPLEGATLRARSSR